MRAISGRFVRDRFQNHLPGWPILWVRADGGDIGDPQLCRLKIQRRYNCPSIATGAGMGNPAQASPHQNVAVAEDLCPRIDVADDQDVLFAFEAMAGTQISAR